MAKAEERTPEAQKDRLFISTLAKGLNVLRCFTTKGPELTVSEISGLTGIPQPTAWRICHTLLELGYLVADPDRARLRLGLPVLGLGYSVLSAVPIERLAISEMEAIAARYEGAVSLGAPDGLDMVYIQRCQGSAIVHSNLRIGSRVPMATSGTGWAYLAALPGDERQMYFDAFRSRQEGQWEEVGPALKDALKLFEKVGYVTNLGHMHPRINSVAVPVRSPDGKNALSLSAGGIGDVFTADILKKVGEDLIDLSEKLGPSVAHFGMPNDRLTFSGAG